MSLRQNQSPCNGAISCTCFLVTSQNVNVAKPTNEGGKLSLNQFGYQSGMSLRQNNIRVGWETVTFSYQSECHCAINKYQQALFTPPV